METVEKVFQLRGQRSRSYSEVKCTFLAKGRPSTYGRPSVVRGGSIPIEKIVASISCLVVSDVPFAGEISGPDAAAVLVTPLRLGPVDGSAGTHQPPVRDRGAGQHRQGRRVRCRTELGIARPEWISPRQQQAGRVPQQSHETKRLSARSANLTETAFHLKVSVAEEKPHGVLSDVVKPH